MIKDYRPYYIKKIWLTLYKLYIKYKLAPQMTSFGKHHFIVKPWYVEVFGAPIHIGDHLTIMGCRDRKTHLTVWTAAYKEKVPGIKIGDHVLISPGVRVSAANSIEISDNCMLASGVYITDSDWHDIYDRARPAPERSRVVLEENVWVGDSAIICKGVTIGKNSVIGAGSVVTSDVPENVIAAGNPARVIRPLNPERPVKTRKDFFPELHELDSMYRFLEKEGLKGNTTLGWLRSLILPRKEV